MCCLGLASPKLKREQEKGRYSLCWLWWVISSLSGADGWCRRVMCLHCVNIQHSTGWGPRFWPGRTVEAMHLSPVLDVTNKWNGQLVGTWEMLIKHHNHDKCWHLPYINQSALLGNAHSRLTGAHMHFPTKFLSSEYSGLFTAWFKLKRFRKNTSIWIEICTGLFHWFSEIFY